MFPELVELYATKVLGEHVRRVLCSFNEVELHLARLDGVANKVVAQINVFDALFLHWVRGKEYRTLVVTK
jgi:hypothetical protein